MHLLIAPILFWIAWADVRTHLISNRILLLLTLIALFTLDLATFEFVDHAPASIGVLAVSLILAMFCGLGMGDVKLLAVLAFLVLPPDLASYQMFLVVGGLTALVSALFISRGDFRKSLQIPLAPAISIAAIISLFAK